MRILVVDDEVGIREGVAAFLQLHGHLVDTAGDLDAALLSLHDGDFDLVVTDWRLGQHTATEILNRVRCPCYVISGAPDEVPVTTAVTKVLAKPVDLGAIVAEVEGMAEAPRGDDFDQVIGALPVDTRCRVRLVLDLVAPGDVEICDDGEFVSIRATVEDHNLGQIELCGGDLQVLPRQDGLRLELRLHRDGRPADLGCVVKPGETWPEGGDAIAVDLDAAAVSPGEFLTLVDRVAEVRQRDGREVWLLNVPEHLRFLLEALGRGRQMPMRPVAGPRLPEVLCALWR